MLTSNEWKLVDKPLRAGLTLFIVITLLKKKYIDLPVTIKKIKTNIQTYKVPYWDFVIIIYIKLKTLHMQVNCLILTFMPMTPHCHRNCYEEFKTQTAERILNSELVNIRE